MEIHYLVIALIVISALCIVPLLALLAIKTSKAIQSTRLERLVRKNEHFLQSLVAENGKAKEETLAYLDRLGDTRLVEQLIDRAVSITSRPVGDFRELYDATGITQQYIALIEKSKSWKRRAFAAEKLGLIGSPKALPVLLSTIRDVKNEDEDVRSAALRALGRIRDERAIPFLIEALGYPETWLPPRIGEILVSIGEPSIAFLLAELRRSRSEHTRMWAAEILGWLHAAGAAPALIEALSDVSPEVRAKAAGALGKIKDDRAVYTLLELLVSDPVPFVRVKVSQALGLIGHPAVIDYLINTLKDPEWWVRVRAVEALEKLGENAVAALLPALEDEDLEVRKRAAMALERIGYIDKILDEYAQPEFKQSLRKILFLIAEAGVIETISQRLATADKTLKKRIVRLLGEARARRAAGPLLELLLGTSEWSLKARIIESLGKIGANEAIPYLIEHLRDPEDWVRKSTVEALGRLEAQDIADDIANLLDDPSPAARESALEALLKLKIAKHCDKIEGLLLDPAPRVKQTAIKVIRELGLSLNEEAALRLLTDASEEVRGEAIKYFSHKGDARRAADIVRLLHHSSASLKREIVAFFKAVPSVDFRELMTAIKPVDLQPEALAALIETASLVKGAEAHQFIATFAESADSSLREKAFTALVRFSVKGHEEIFAKGLFDPAANVRIAVLTGIAADRQLELLRRAEALSNDPDENVRTALALALGASASKELKQQAERMLNDPSITVNAGALISLAAFDDPSLREIIHSRCTTTHMRTAINAAKHDPRVKPLLELISHNAKQSNNLEVAFILNENEREFTQDLIQRIRESHDPEMRRKAMEILMKLPTGEFLTSILAIMKRDPLEELRVHAMEIVSMTGRENEAVSAISSMLVDPSPSVRRRAAEILGRYGTPHALEALLHVLDTSDRKFREAVTTSLSTILTGNPENFDKLLRSIPETKTRKIGMAWLMGKTRKRGSMRFLINLLDDGDADVRAAAVGALAKFKRKQLLAHFEKLIYDPSEHVRAATVNALAAIGDDAAFALCERTLEDIDEYVRRRAVLGLARINPQRCLAVVRRRADAPSELLSYLKGILFATGAQHDESLRDDPRAKSIVEELCPEEEMLGVFQGSSDKGRRLHAFRVLALLNEENIPGLTALALKDPCPKIREEALQYVEQ